jgi:hypothetical protein
MRSGEEIRRELVKFAARWQSYAGSERAEAQTFLNELFACYGRDRRDAGARFEDAHSTTGIMDLHLPGVAIIEMKAPKEGDRLDQHRPQALHYWKYSADLATERTAPPYVVLCSFQQFEIWEPGRYPAEPRLRFTLEELPDRYEALLFLAGPAEEPLFHPSRALTTEAATAVAKVYQELLDRGAAKPQMIRNFMLQLVWLFFAEDYAMIEGRPTEAILKLLAEQDYWTSYLMFGGFFTSLNDPDSDGRHGALRGTTYVDGELFANRALVHLTKGEARALYDIAQFDWSKVDPTIFGSLLDELCQFRVLDPACGCGNFLYLAYRELRSLEHSLKQVIAELARSSGLPVPTGLPYYPLTNLHGIDVVSFATFIARVTLWMGHRQMIDRFGPAEPPLPLVDLSSIQTADALKVAWPEVDCIIGNPPFLGSQHLREAQGDEYLKWLDDHFKVGIKDYCVYWFRRAHDHLQPGQRAGLVGTNSVAQNRARSASLDYVAANGGVITDAAASQDWPGTAAVDVSLVNWVKSPDEPPARFTPQRGRGHRHHRRPAYARHLRWRRPGARGQQGSLLPGPDPGRRRVCPHHGRGAGVAGAAGRRLPAGGASVPDW